MKRDNEIVSYGGRVEVENIVKRDKRAHLVWRWGGGGENFLTRNIVVSHETHLPKKDSAAHSSSFRQLFCRSSCVISHETCTRQYNKNNLNIHIRKYEF